MKLNMKVAGLDLGSNTFLCLVCEVEEKKIVQVYSDDLSVVRLGQGLSQNKKFHPEALVRARQTLEQFKKIIQQHRPDRVLAMATSAARDAENKEELFQICRDLGIPLEIIPGEKEAQITYQGSISGLVNISKSILVLDIGGGSTEYIVGDNKQILFSESLNIGCVRLTEKFINAQPTPANQLQGARDYISDQVSQLVERIQKNNVRLPDHILAVAGTPTTIAQVEIGEFIPEKIDGYKLTLSSLENWVDKLSPLTVDQKIQKGFPAGRADVILIGLMILIETLKKFNQSELEVSTRGVRYGVALEVAHRN